MMAFELSEFEEFIKTDEGQKWFGTFRAGLGLKNANEVEVEKEGVAAKNRELLDEKKAVLKKLEDASVSLDDFKKVKDLFHEFDIEVDGEEGLDYTKVEEALGRLRQSGDDGSPQELEETKRALRRSQRDFEGKSKEVTARDTRIAEQDDEIAKLKDDISKLLVDGAFTTALTKEGYGELIIPNILSALRAKSSAQIQYDEDKGEWKAITDDGRDIESWVKLWKETEDGKALRIAPTNTGGGAGGGGGPAPAKAWKDMSVQERAELFLRNEEAYRALKAQAQQAS